MADFFSRASKAIGDFVTGHPGLILAAIISSVVLFLMSLILIPVAIVRLPADHFVKPKVPGKRRLLALHIAVLVLRNVLGFVFLVLGAIMLVIPGPGWLTILLGVALIDLPLKKRLEIKILSIPFLRKAVNGYRKQKNLPPFQFPE